MHKQTQIQIHGKIVEVDLGMERIIKTLNTIPGVTTHYSCRGTAAAHYRSVDAGYVVMEEPYDVCQQLSDLLTAHIPKKDQPPIKSTKKWIARGTYKVTILDKWMVGASVGGTRQSPLCTRPAVHLTFAGQSLPLIEAVVMQLAGACPTCGKSYFGSSATNFQ